MKFNQALDVFVGFKKEKTHQQPLPVYDKILEITFKVLVFLTPIFFLTITSEVLEFNKQSLIFFAVLIMLAVWVFKVLSTRSASWVKTSLDYAVLFFLGIHLASSLFSIDKVSSFLGYYGRFTGSFLSVLSLVILYFLTVNLVRNESFFRKLTHWFTISSFVVLGFSLCQILGLAILPFIKEQSFNTVGSQVALALYAAIFVIFYQWQLLILKSSKPMKIALIVFIIVALVIMFLINAFTSWLILTLGMVVFLALGVMMSDASHQNWFWKPLVILVLGILFVSFQFLPQSINPRNIINFNKLPLEIQLSNSATWDLVGNSLTSGAKPALLGSGPGTMGIAFGQIKPETLNKTIVWSLNFDRGSTEVANILVENGILGLLAFELTAVLFLIYGLFFLIRKTQHPGRMYAFGFFIIWLSLYLSHFFYFYNTTFYFLFWFTLGMFIAITHWEESGTSGGLSFSSSPRATLSWMFASLLMLAVVLVGGFFQASVYAAELAYVSGIKILNKPEPDFLLVQRKFAQAVNLNRYRDVYYLGYGQNLIFLSSQEAAKSEPDLSKIRSWITDLIAAGNSATSISPYKASNWSALAQFYSSIRPLAIEGTNEAIISSWEKAKELDNQNPAILIQLARAYVVAAQVIDPSIAGRGVDADQDGLSDTKEQELESDPTKVDTNDNGTSDGDEVKAGFNPATTGRLTNAQLTQFIRMDSELMKKAEDALVKAIELKDDLPDSRIELARVYERANKLTEARKALDEAVKKFPGNLEIRFEQGRITYNQRKFTEAEKIFLEVVKAEPNHANALFSLGQVYLQKGELTKALEQFEKVREITGPNVDLEKLINDLKAVPAE